MKSLLSANVRHRVSEPLKFKHSYTLEVFNAIDDKRDFIFFSQVFFAKVKKKLNYVRNWAGLLGINGKTGRKTIKHEERNGKLEFWMEQISTEN